MRVHLRSFLLMSLSIAQAYAAPPAPITIGHGYTATTPPVASGKVPNSATQSSSRGDVVLRAYDPEDYRLAYDVFVGANDLANALRVAQEAVRQKPNDPYWHLRLARVAEWNGQTELAWEHRLWLYRHGQADRETREALLRLGLAYGTPEMMLDLWLEEARRRDLSATQWENLYQLFESSGRPAEGSRFFERQYRRIGEVRFLSWAAVLAERAGLDEDALRLHLERASLEPFSASAVLSAVNFLVRRDRLAEAHTLLESYSSRIPDEEYEYWRTLGDIAWELVDIESATRAYQRYLRKDNADSFLWSRLIYLVEYKDPREAGLLALSVYRRLGELDHVMLALELLAAPELTSAQAEVFAAIRAKDLPTLESNPRFLLLRATHEQRRQRPIAAWRDLERALTLAPDDDAVASAVLWFLIDRREADRLQPLLSKWRMRAENTPALWLPFAAAFHVLDRYREAAPWYRKAIELHPHDMLLLLNYADLVERLQQPGMAQRMRRHAWLELRKRKALEALVTSASLSISRPLFESRKRLVQDGLAPVEISSSELLAVARLFILDRPGDPAMHLVQRVANRLRDLDTDGAANEQANELILAWAIGSGQFLNARSWLWLNYLRHHQTAPGWAESQTALQLNDTTTIARLLETRSDAMPIYNRYDSAYTLEHWQQALDIAFHGMEKNPVDEELHERYRIHAPLHSNFLYLDWESERLGDYHVRTIEKKVHLHITPRLALDVDLAGARQFTREATLDALAPNKEQRYGIAAHWRGTRGDTNLAWWRQETLANLSGWRISQNWRWNRHLTLAATMEKNAAATDTLPLRVAGKQSGLRLDVAYALAKRESVNLGLRLTDYATQFGDSLGTGLLWELGFTHRVRTEYPDWYFRGTMSSIRYRYESQPGDRVLAALPPEIRSAVSLVELDPIRYFLPESNKTFRFCFGMGENLAGQNLRSVYSRGWRHYYELCVTNNNVAGRGYSLDLGLVGSLSGEDHVFLGLTQSSGGVGIQTTNRHWKFGYRHYF